jgi:hypothetical protein
MSYPPAMPTPGIDQLSPHPRPGQTARYSPGRPNEFHPYPRGMSLPASIEHRQFYRTTYGSMMDLPDQGPYMQEQMSMVNMTPSMTGHQMPTLGTYLYGQSSGSRRPAPDDDQDNTRKNKRRTND